MIKKQVKPNAPENVSEDMNQELLRAMLVSNESLQRVNEMLQVMNQILTRLLEERKRPARTILEAAIEHATKPSETPPETVAIVSKRANGPTAEAAKLEAIAIERELDAVKPEPVKSLTLKDLLGAVQECMSEHGMEEAGKRLMDDAGKKYATCSLVPVEKLEEVINRVKGVRPE